MEDFYVDIHCHATMRAMHTSPVNGYERNHWSDNFNDVIDTRLGRWAWQMSAGVAKVSQSNFYNCIKGKTRVVFDSLYPIERGFINFRKVPQKLIGVKAAETLVVTSSGVSVEQFRKYRTDDDYFKDLQEQYQFLVDKQGKSPCGKYNFKIVNNFFELKEVTESQPNTIAILVTIEGAHVFGCGRKSTEKTPESELTQTIIENIQKVKQWEYPPFFMTFAHHFWNQLCGHSPTFPTPTRVTCNQNPGLDTGFREIGWIALKQLLSRKNGKRILIDTRHMSAKSRMEYYTFIQNHNSENPNDKIPIISSHTAVNGFETMEASLEQKDNQTKKKNSAFCNWSLNISNEEARMIHESGGIAGIILDKGRHSGGKLLKSIESITNPEEKKQAFLKLILDNIFQYIQAVGQKSGWDILTLGTDFDGVITHFDCYENMSKLPELKADLIGYLKKHRYKEELWFGYRPEEIFEKIFTNNAMQFLERNFV